MTMTRGDWHLTRDIHEHRGWPNRFELNRIGPVETAVLDPTVDPDVPLRQLLNVVWNAANHPQCPGFDDSGQYVGYKASTE